MVVNTDLVDRIALAYQDMRGTAGGPRQTPLEYSPSISSLCGARVYLKCEHHQFTGSFKFRGALNKLLSLSSEERLQGVTAASTGNHGMGVARAAQILGIDAAIYVPADASPKKLKAIEGYGAQIERVNGSCLDAERKAREVAHFAHKTFISPYNDIDVMAGQGTIAREMVDQIAELDAVYISVGGGGLIGGMGAFFKNLNKHTKIIGCWPETAPIMKHCLEAGKIVTVDEKPTLSDATMGNLEPDTVTFPVCQKVIDEMVTVTEDEIAESMRLLASEENWMVEGAAGVALAACLKQKHQGGNVAVLLCGRNISVDKFLSIF